MGGFGRGAGASRIARRRGRYRGAVDVEDGAEGNNQGSYEWEHLNERPENEFCGEGFDWVVSASGTIELTFFEREAGAISAVAVSNDENYTPDF